MALINTNGQPLTTSADVEAEVTPVATPAPAQRVQLTPVEVQRIVGAYARLKELSSATIANTRDDAEKQGLVNFLHGALLTHAEEFFGCWVAINQEYTPLINGFTALLRRSLTRIDQSAAIAAQAQKAAQVDPIKEG